MQRVSATFEIVTPMFMGGAVSTNTPEGHIRPSSIKGMLRFWWRAWAWNRYADRTRLREAEDPLFGSADERHGQSSFLITVQSFPRLKTKRPDQDELLTTENGSPVGDGAAYLGYGLCNAFGSRNKGIKRRQLERAYFLPRQKFTVNLFPRLRGGSLEQEVLGAFRVFSLLGGLGTRTRKGWGSVSLLKIEGVDDPKNWIARDREHYRELLAEVLAPCAGYTELPPFSAFSKHSLVDIVAGGNDPDELIDLVGRKMLLYRNWRSRNQRDAATLSNGSHPRFLFDHDGYRRHQGNWTDGKGRPTHPERAVFGLPHTYGPNPKVTVVGANHGRRASPLMIHIHKTGHEYIALITVLQSDFLPKGERIKAGSKVVDSAIDYGVLRDFIEGPKHSKSGKLYFPDRIRVLGREGR